MTLSVAHNIQHGIIGLFMGNEFEGRDGGII
jgi:hypothetical protein